MRRFLVVVVGFGLVAVGCSSSGGEVSGPSVSGSEVSSSTVDESTTTDPGSLTGLEDVLEGEPPSSTVSSDVDEQTAADVVHWSTEIFFACTADPQGCDLSAFDEARQGDSLMKITDVFRGYRERGETVLPDARDPESRVVWARKSTTNPDVVGVLSCSRNYYALVDADGEVIDDTSSIFLFLWRVERGDDDRFRISRSVRIDEYQPDSEGGDLCLEYEGSEVPDVVFEELVL